MSDDELEAVILPHIIAAAVAGAAAGLLPLIKMGIGFDEVLINDAAVSFARRYAGMQVVGINATTQKAIQKHVSWWLSQHPRPPLDDLAKLLEPTFGAARAKTISVTEVTNALSGGKIESWKALNDQLGTDLIKGMTWSTANDERVCPVCAPLGGLVFGDSAEPASIAEQEANAISTNLGDPFIHPGGTGAAERFKGKTYERPPAHPRCRCTLKPII